jgi:hypothetical protein
MKTLKDGLLVAGLIAQLFLILAGLRNGTSNSATLFHLPCRVVRFLVHDSYLIRRPQADCSSGQEFTLDALKTAV